MTVACRNSERQHDDCDGNDENHDGDDYAQRSQHSSLCLYCSSPGCDSAWNFRDGRSVHDRVSTKPRSCKAEKLHL